MRVMLIRQLATVPEVAEYLRLKPKTIYSLVEDGVLNVRHGLFRVGGSIRFDLSQLEVGLAADGY